MKAKGDYAVKAKPDWFVRAGVLFTLIVAVAGLVVAYSNGSQFLVQGSNGVVTEHQVSTATYTTTFSTTSVSTVRVNSTVTYTQNPVLLSRNNIPISVGSGAFNFTVTGFFSHFWLKYNVHTPGTVHYSLANSQGSFQGTGVKEITDALAAAGGNTFSISFGTNGETLVIDFSIVGSTSPSGP